MRRRDLAAGIAALVPATLVGVRDSVAQARFVRIATAGSGGNYYRLGGGLAAIWNDTVEGVRASIQATGGTVQNLDLLADREVEVAYLAGSIGQQAYKNEGQFAQRPQGRYAGLRAIATVYPNPQWFLAMQWVPEIRTLRDLKGKRVSVGMQGSQFDLVHAGDAGSDEHQRGRQARPRQMPVATAIAQVCANRDDHRQGADDHRRQGSAGPLDGAGKEEVVKQVADRGQLEGLDPVGTAELRQPAAVHPRQRQGDEPEGEVAPDRLQGAGVFRQQQGADEHQPPQQPGGQCVKGSDPHGRRSVAWRAAARHSATQRRPATVSGGGVKRRWPTYSRAW